MSAKSLLAESDAACNAFMKSDENNQEQLLRVLEYTVKLFDYAERGESQRGEVDALFKERKIRTTGSTRNQFTPFVKLVFRAAADRSKIGRYAGALRYAKWHEVGAAEIGAFIKENNGVVACDRKDKEAHQGYASERKPEKLEDALERMRAAGADSSDQVLTNFFKDQGPGLFTVLVEKRAGKKGGVRLLGFRPSDGRTAAAHKRLTE